MTVLNLKSTQRGVPERDSGGYLPLESYAALGDGRSVALTGADGSVDWWCVPHMDSPPLFDRLLDPEAGGYFRIAPTVAFSIERNYRQNSNVLETVFITDSGRARLVESLNSGPAGRLPWAELARRIEGIEGEVQFSVEIRFGTQADTICPFLSSTGNGTIFHAGDILGMFLHGPNTLLEHEGDLGIRVQVAVAAGQRALFAIVAGRNEPLVIPSIELINSRIDGSDREWKQWAESLDYQGVYRSLVTRSALALKLLISSPSGSIMAAATTSLPERVGGDKNYDYRFAWIRDAGYTIGAFLAIGAQPEAKAAFTWLLHRLGEHGPHVCYTLDGKLGTDARMLGLPGYKNSPPLIGNDAADQLQHGVYGDIFETARCFIDKGNILDSPSAAILSNLADKCADGWMRKDSGIWELPDQEHYTMSKVSCWQALSRAVELAESGHLPTTCRDRWDRARQRILVWIDQNCWSERLQAYTFYPGSDRLDASLALAVRFGFPRPDRLRSTLAAVQASLAAGPFHFRYSDVDKEEGCFLACTFWLAEAYALLGDHNRGSEAFVRAVEALDVGTGIYSEMIDPQSGEYLGNLPQALTHLALIGAAATLSGCQPDR
jgi:GH15 family glucan-1,4-alpha-glucosidase